VADEVALQKKNATGQTGTGTDSTDKVDTPDTSVQSVYVRVGPLASIPVDALAANAMLSLINVATYLLGRQVASLAALFEKDGGFTGRMYRVRTQR
jgi:four helix bundle suffix protein